MDNEKYIEIAKDYLTTKARDNYYEIYAIDDQYEEWRFLQKFNDQEVSALLGLRDKYGEEDYVNHLAEVFDDPDMVHDFTCGCEMQRIKLNHPCHLYIFSRHELVGDSLERHNCRVELSDDDYILLLAYALEDNGMNINKLKYANKRLYNYITNEVDNTLCDEMSYMGRNPYLITMDEINDDVQRIKAQNPDLKSFSNLGYLV